jgi:hypothetical protein
VRRREGGDLASSARANVATKRDLLRFVRGAIARGELPPEAEQQAIESLGTLVKRFALTRRDLIKATAATAGVSLVVYPLTRSAEAKSILAAIPSLTASVLRRDDMLALRFDFYNLVRDNQNNLVRQNAGQPAYIVATPGYGADYAPQNIAERAYLETAAALTPRPAEPAEATAATVGETPADPGMVEALLAGPTRVAFRVPDTMTAIPFTLPALLNFAQFQMNVVPSALPPLAAGDVPSPLPVLRAPTETETALETPWHLILSPHGDSTFAHSLVPVVRNGRTELWHSRLAVRKPSETDPTKFVADELDAAKRTVRAVWANPFDINTFPPNADQGPFRMSLKPLDRYQIVRLTADFSLTTKPEPFYNEPQTISVEKLMLSALGAWQSSRYVAEPPKDFNLGEWKHISTMARDHYVKVVYLGWLIPFGHPAALVKVTERKIVPVPNQSYRGAYLRQRFFIVVRRPVLSYPEDDPQPNEGREFPYTRVEIKTTVTPTLDDPMAAAWTFEGKGDLAFIPVVGGKPFQFGVKGTDRDGQESEFTLPLVFVSYPIGGNIFTDGDIATVVHDYNTVTGCPSFTADMKKAVLNGQKVGMAPSTQSELKKQNQTGGKPGDTAAEVKSLSFGTVDPTVTVPFGDAPFYPKWTEADVRLNGVEQVKGGTGLDPTVIQPHPDFVTGGFNSSGVFAKLKTNVGLTFVDPSEPAGDRSGGLVNPDMSIAALSRKLGPVGNSGPIGALPTQFDPAVFFKDAKILGGILLKDIIEVIVGFANEAQIPKLVTNTVYPAGDTTQPPSEIVVTMNFVPKLKQDLLKIFTPDDPGGSLTIDATFRTPIVPPGPPTFEIVGDLRNCKVTLISGIEPANLISIHFSQLKFTTKTGSKPNVDIDINEVKFEGVLNFVNTLKDYLKLGNSGPSIDIQPTSVTAGFSIPIPTVGVGVLTIQNIAFGAGVTVPFTGKPARARFNFSEREDQFLVTVMGLGGGGFFAISLGLDGLEILEMGIEVGASVALDLGVASGEVHALAGFYYRLEKGTPPPDKVEIDGYVRLGGSVNVLGIASVSVEFYLGLKYEDPPNELWGQASLTVEIEVLCFSKSFSFSVERRIAGGSGDSAALMPGILALGGNGGRMASLAPVRTKPLFAFTDLMNQDEWNAYAGAFATS